MSRVAIVCHDAGGAEILSSWLLRCDNLCSVVLEGPAIGIFNRKCVDAERLSLVEAIAKCDWVLCGTGWASDLERQSIKLGRQQGKKTVAFLDHWVNYKERFEEADGSATLPDEIWVGDVQAKYFAEAEFPNISIKLQVNPYFADLRDDFAKLETSKAPTNKKSILYVCEPIREHAYLKYGNERHWGYTEEDALKYFLENIESLHLDIAHITIRPHPSEKLEKYQWAKALAPSLIKFGGEISLMQETVDADVVVGCHSMAMVVALLAGKRVISCVPPGGTPCQLPQTEIEHLQNLVEK
jgi:hypothetical protein|tara:strand:- start:296 stop:1189 length:894 start_codon:yes stop_codon:yes gene_type:complete